MTVSAWINPRTLGEANFGTIMIQEIGVETDWWIQLCSSNAAECPSTPNTFVFSHVGRSNFGEWYAPANTIKFNQWQHIVVEYNCAAGDSSDPLFFYNGSQVTAAESETPSGIANCNADVQKAIGGNPLGTGNNNSAFDGKIDDVRVYNRALSPAEVKQLYQLGTVRITQ
jgi:hypothetical protein